MEILEKESLEQKILRLEAECKQLKQVETRQFELEQNGRIGHWEWYIQSDEVYWSKGLYKVFDTDPADFDKLTKASFMDFVHEDDRANISKIIQDTFINNTPYTVNHRLTINGKIHHVLGKGTLERDVNGNPFRLWGTAQDVTDQVKSENALAERTKIVQAMFEAIPDLIFYVDKDGRILDMQANNPALLAAPIEEILGKIMYDFLPKDIARGLHNVSLKVLAENKMYNYLYTLTTVTGEDKDFEARIAPTGQGQVCMIVRDTTEYNKTLLHLKRSERLVSVGTLAAGMAHEINNPVGAMLLAARLGLKNKNLPPASSSLFADIVRDAKRCGKIVSSILQFSRDGVSIKEPQNINHLIKESQPLLHWQSGALNCKIDYQLTDNISLVDINKTEIEQVLMNLVRNATDAGATEIKIITSQKDPNILLTIVDNGAGIPKDIQERVFDPFFTTRTKENGTGLGLSIVHGILINHGATIDLSSALKIGTTIKIAFPVSNKC